MRGNDSANAPEVLFRGVRSSAPQLLQGSRGGGGGGLGGGGGGFGSLFKRVHMHRFQANRYCYYYFTDNKWSDRYATTIG